MSDALTDILESIRMEGSVFSRAMLEAPWGVESGTTPTGMFHAVVSGGAWIRLADGDDPLRLERGDIVMMPFGDNHLLTDEPGSFSALHRLATDEVYHFYLGDPVEMLLLHADGASSRPVLGPDLIAGQQVQLVVPRGTWQGSRLVAGGRWALLGTTMAPGFDSGDFELGRGPDLEAAWPDQAEAISALTRP